MIRVEAVFIILTQRANTQNSLCNPKITLYKRISSIAKEKPNPIFANIINKLNGSYGLFNLLKPSIKA